MAADTTSDADARHALFAQLLPLLGDNAPPSNVTAVGHMLREWLQAVVADAETEVDSGVGLGAYDLFVKMGGETIWIQIKKDETYG